MHPLYCTSFSQRSHGCAKIINSTVLYCHACLQRVQTLLLGGFLTQAIRCKDSFLPSGYKNKSLSALINEFLIHLNSDLAVKDVTAHFYKNAPVSYVLAYKIGHMVQCIFTISAGSSGWVEVAFCDDDVRPLIDVPVYRARSAIADDNTIQVNGTLKAAENKLYIYISKALATNLSMSCIYPTTR